MGVTLVKDSIWVADPLCWAHGKVPGLDGRELRELWPLAHEEQNPPNSHMDELAKR